MISNLAAGVQAFTSNAFLVAGERTVLVDTGANFDIVPEIEATLDRIGGDETSAVSVDAVILTHTHPDHVGNLDAVRDRFDVETWGFDPDSFATDNPIRDEETLRLGDHEYVAIHTPGHKNDHLCFYSGDTGVLFSGDLIFQNGGFGRTDLAEGDRATLIDSIDRVRRIVGDDIAEMHVGHGPSITQNPVEHIDLARQAASMGR